MAYYHLAIVEDCTTALSTLQSFLDHYSSLHDDTFLISTFSNGRDFLAAIESTRFHLVFLDIDLPDLSGMDIGFQLSEHHIFTEIIFYTAFKEYALNAYHIHALGYIEKGISYNQFEYHMTRYLYMYRQAHTPVCDPVTRFLFQWNDSLFQIPYDSILYFEKHRNRIYIHTEKETYQYYDTIKRLTDKLDHRMFTQINQGCIVNLEQIHHLSPSLLYLQNNEMLNVSTSKYPVIRDQLLLLHP